MAERTVAIDDAFWGGHAELSWAYLCRQAYEQAIAEAEKLITNAPQRADSYALLADNLNAVGRSEEAIEMMEKAMQLDPAIPPWQLNILCRAYTDCDRLTEAMETAKIVFDRSPSHEDRLSAHLSLAVLYAELGQEEDVRAEAAEVLKLAPDFSLETALQSDPDRDLPRTKRIVAALRKAGLK